MSEPQDAPDPQDATTPQDVAPGIPLPMTGLCGGCRRMGTVNRPEQMGRSGWMVCEVHRNRTDPLDPEAPVPEPMDDVEGGLDEDQPVPEPQEEETDA